MTMTVRCTCRGRSGERKRLYRTRQAAVSDALHRGWQPTTYRCPAVRRGYHLTHGGRP